MKRFLIALALCWGWVADAATTSGLYSATTWARTNLLVKSASDTVALGDVTADTVTVGDGTGIGGTPMDVRWFGAVADDATSDYDEFTDAAEYCQLYGRTMYVPGGVWNFGSAAEFIDVTGSLTIVGDGPASVIKHTGVGGAQSIFSFSTGTNLVVSGLAFHDVRYVWNIATGHPQIENATFKNCSTSNAAYFVYGVQTMDSGQNFIKNLNLNGVRYYGNTNVANMFVFLSNIPYDNVSIDRCWVEGGRNGIFVIHDNPPMTLNPHDYSGLVTVTRSMFTDLEFAYDNCQGLKVISGELLAEHNTFRRGSKVDSTGVDQQAIYLYARKGMVRDNKFVNWGNTTDKSYTIVCKGASLIVNPYDTNTVTTSYNHASGWGITIENNLFIDSLTATTGCGKIGFDTDGVNVRNNTFINFGSTRTIEWSPGSTGYSELGFVDISGNRFLWCKPSQYIYIAAKSDNSIPARYINISGNQVIGDQASTANYLIDIPFAAKHVTAANNIIYNSLRTSHMRIGGAASGRNFEDIRFINNKGSNFAYGLVVAASDTSSTNEYHDLVVEGNYGDTLTGSLLYLSSTNKIVRGRFYDNFMTNSATYGFPRRGTAGLVLENCTHRTNGSVYAYSSTGASSWLLNPPFYGAQSAEPTEGLVTGGMYYDTDDSKLYVYTGAAFAPVTP